MKRNFTMTRFYPVDRFELFDYFSTDRLLEKWAFPDGMSLMIPLFEARQGGHYRYEHKASNGLYVCTGFIEQFVPGELLVQRDEKITGPDGKQLYSNLLCRLTFSSRPGGSQVYLEQEGFQSEQEASECEQGWTQCLARLDEILSEENRQSSDELARGTDSNIGG